MTTRSHFIDQPDAVISAKDVFGLAHDMQVPAFSEPNEYVPEIDETYQFNAETTLAILAGFMHDCRVLLQGYHGTGKSTHIEQVAARLNWPCIRVNLDGNITRIDLIGRDAIVVEDGKQVTQFKEGIIPWALQRPVALVFDEYDAARPDVMFILQRLLEHKGKFTLIDQNRVIAPHACFRLFATANTVGLGDSTGLYHGTQPINQGQMDRWNIVTTLNYVPAKQEEQIILAKLPALNTKQGTKMIASMVAMANMTRTGFMAGDISTVMSPRTVLHWAKNYQIFDSLSLSFTLTFLNKCDESERAIIAEYYQRCFGHMLFDTEADA